MAELTVDVLPDSTRICYLGKQAEIRLTVTRPTDSEFKGTLRLELVNYWGNQVKVVEQPVELTKLSKMEVTKELSVSEVGYYEINLKIIAEGGTVLERKKVWSVAVLDYPRQFPADSPFGTYTIGNVNLLADIVPRGFYANMAQMGARWGTIDTCWDKLEPEKGKYNWAYYDKWFTEALKAGITPIPHLYAIPQWVSSWRPGDPGDSWTYPPIDWEQWERFVYDFVSHYKDWLVYLRIWNEPNVEGYWHGTAADYAKLVKIASQAARRAKPDIKIIIEAASSRWPTIYYDAVAFFDQVHKSDPCSDWDIIAIHNYMFNNTDFPERTEFLPVYDKFVEWRNKNKPNAEVWDTEFACMAETWGEWLGVGEKHQAQWLARTHVLGFSKGLKKMVWFPGYCWPDSVTAPYYNPAGLLKVDLTPRPAYVAYHTMASALSWARYERALSLSGDRHGMVFKTPQGYVTAFWSVDANSACRLSLKFEQQQKISVVDIMGRTSEKVPGSKGEIVVDIGEDIIYVYSKTIPEVTCKIPVILDTDIGSDIDDMWAIAMLLNSPELDIKLITVSEGDTASRAKLLAKFLDIAGRTDIPIGIGPKKGKGIFRQSSWIADYDMTKYPGVVYQDGGKAMVDAVMGSEIPIKLIAIGPLPTVEAALDLEPRIAEKAEFIGMFGSIYYPAENNPEYNVEIWPTGFQKVCAAPWRKTITPLDTCGKVRLDGLLYQKVLNCHSKLTDNLIEAYRQYLSWFDQADVPKGAYPDKCSSILYDTVAIYLAISEDFVNIETLPINVTDDGRTCIDKKNGRLVRCAISWKDMEKFKDFLVKRIAK
jgi:inosine-uridine nucleoside N-ribohydrolase